MDNMATQQKTSSRSAASRSKRGSGADAAKRDTKRTRSRSSSGASKARPNAREAQQAQRAPEQAKGTISTAASKAKGPLLAGGAALAGLAGGIALGSRRSRSRGIHVSRPRRISVPGLSNGGSTAKALGTVAKEIGKAGAQIGKAGYRVGELTTEVRGMREQASGDR